MSSSRPLAAFTMVEIAICIGIIGFALVAIIGVLPTGLRVQKDNREETVINQDATYLLELIRSGSMGADDLTNHVDHISLGVTNYSPAPPLSPTNFSTGREIIGLLSNPNYPSINQAKIRAFSGSLAEKGITTNARNFSFRYLLTVAVAKVAVGNSVFTNSLGQSILTNNLYEVRLNYRWPLLPNDIPGKGAKTFRTLVGCQLLNDPGNPALWFFEPQTFSP